MNPTAAGKRRMLLISDSADGQQRLQALLAAAEVVIAHVAAPVEVCHACRCSYDLIIVDVGPEIIVEVLREIRSNAQQAQITVLVETGRLGQTTHLAGVLPHFRAMPCSVADLLKLAGDATDSTTHRSNARGLL